jgi:membrane protein involved in colicin uptake
LEEVRKETEAKAKEQANKDAELAKIKAEQDKEAAVKAEREKIEAEKKAEADKKVREEKEEADRQAKLEKDKKYQKFLKENGYTNDTEFHIQRSGNKVVLYKKVGELEI